MVSTSGEQFGATGKKNTAPYNTALARAAVKMVLDYGLLCAVPQGGQKHRVSLRWNRRHGEKTSLKFVRQVAINGSRSVIDSMTSW
jgi:hypothetical protein